MIEIESTILERFRLALRKRISIPDLEIMFRELPEIIGRDIEIRFAKDYVCQKQDKTIFFQTPKTWKDHFKMKYRRHWLIKRWIKKHPIQFAKHFYDVSKNVVFPDVAIPKGNIYQNNFIIYQTVEK